MTIPAGVAAISRPAAAVPWSICTAYGAASVALTRQVAMGRVKSMITRSLGCAVM